LRYVEIHLADPKLNAEMVAQACGISRRYLSHLLRQNGTSFPNLIWDWRLKTAHEWLSSEVGNNISIAEVAFRIGFKSPAHFSRLFKRVYKMSPREYRATKIIKKAHTEPKDFYVSGSTSIQ
jgi:AraC-like DNA-binding protein